MAKEKRISKRMQITLSPSSHKVLTEYKSATGESISALIDQMILEAAPVLYGLVDAHKAISEDKAIALNVFKDALSSAKEGLDQTCLDFDTESKKYLSRKG